MNLHQAMYHTEIILVMCMSKHFKREREREGEREREVMLIE